MLVILLFVFDLYFVVMVCMCIVVSLVFVYDLYYVWIGFYVLYYVCEVYVVVDLDYEV